MYRTLVGSLAAGLTIVGALAMLAPKNSAGQYGMATGDPAGLGFVRATGARDVLFGLVLFGELDHPRTLRRVLGLVSMLGLADAAILASVRGIRPQHVIHLAGFGALALATLAIDAPE